MLKELLGLKKGSFPWTTSNVEQKRGLVDLAKAIMDALSKRDEQKKGLLDLEAIADTALSTSMRVKST